MKIETTTKFTTDRAGNINIITEQESLGAFFQIANMTINTQEQAIREALVKLGWTPPPTHEEKAQWRSNDERDLEVGRAIERAGAELPEGFEITIEIEQGAGTVRLHIPDSDAYESDFGGGDYFYEEINAAVDRALALANNGAQAIALQGEPVPGTIDTTNGKAP